MLFRCYVSDIHPFSNSDREAFSGWQEFRVTRPCDEDHEEDLEMYDLGIDLFYADSCSDEPDSDKSDSDKSDSDCHAIDTNTVSDDSDHSHTSDSEF
jgi:hypothetical protein